MPKYVHDYNIKKIAAMVQNFKLGEIARTISPTCKWHHLNRYLSTHGYWVKKTLMDRDGNEVI